MHQRTIERIIWFCYRRHCKWRHDIRYPQAELSIVGSACLTSNSRILGDLPLPSENHVKEPRHHSGEHLLMRNLRCKRCLDEITPYAGLRRVSAKQERLEVVYGAISSQQRSHPKMCGAWLGIHGGIRGAGSGERRREGGSGRESRGGGCSSLAR
jgi:hypothetical protein